METGKTTQQNTIISPKFAYSPSRSGNANAVLNQHHPMFSMVSNLALAAAVVIVQHRAAQAGYISLSIARLKTNSIQDISIKVITYPLGLILKLTQSCLHKNHYSVNFSKSLYHN